MSKLLLKAMQGPGHVAHVTPEIAGWTYVGFDLHKLDAGQSVCGKTEDKEVCLVFVTGKGKVTANGEDLGLLGDRMSPFEGKPWSVYLPQGPIGGSPRRRMSNLRSVRRRVLAVDCR